MSDRHTCIAGQVGDRYTCAAGQISGKYPCVAGQVNDRHTCAVTVGGGNRILSQTNASYFTSLLWLCASIVNSVYVNGLQLTLELIYVWSCFEIMRNIVQI